MVLAKKSLKNSPWPVDLGMPAAEADPRQDPGLEAVAVR